MAGSVGVGAGGASGGSGLLAPAEPSHRALEWHDLQITARVVGTVGWAGARAGWCCQWCCGVVRAVLSGQWCQGGVVVVVGGARAPVGLQPRLLLRLAPAACIARLASSCQLAPLRLSG